MAHLGGFSEDALKLFQEAASEKGFDFAESEETYDFTRCVRPDGSAYGTSGTCRKGSPAGAKEKAEPRTEGGRKRRATAEGKAEAKAASRKAAGEKISENAARTRRLKEELEKVRDKMKGASPEEQNRLIAEASKRASEKPKAPAPEAKPKKLKTDFRKDVEEATAKRKEKEAKIVALQAKTADLKKAWQEKEATVREAKKALQSVNSQTKGDKSPEARKRRLEVGKALDKAEREAEKASKMWFGAQKAMKMFTMTPEQRKAEREWNKTKKTYG